MSEHYVTCNVDDHIAVVTIDRPPVNALDLSVTQQLRSIFQQLQGNNDIRAFFLTAKGKAFMAGAELKSFPALNRRTGEALA